MPSRAARGVAGAAAAGRLPFLALAAFGVSLGLAVASDRAFFADGVYLFVRMLEDQGLVEIWPLRRFADYLLQVPAVAALEVGVSDIAWLKVLFNVGCFLPWPLALWLCHRMAPRHLWLVLLACAAGYLNAAFVAVGQHIIAHALFWPALFALLFVRPLTRFAAGALLFCALVLVRSYELMLFLSPALLALALWRALERPLAAWRRAVFLAAAGLFAASSAIAFFGIVTPQDDANYNSFLDGLLMHLADRPWTFGWSLLLVLLMALCWVVPRLRGVLAHPAGRLLLAVAVADWGLRPLLAPGTLEPLHQHTLRFTNLAAPFGLLPLALIVAFRPGWIAGVRRTWVALAALALLAQSLWQITATWQWQGYVGALRGVVATGTGPLPLQDTLLAKGEADGQSYRFTWPWAMPLLSYVFAPGGDVRAVVYQTGNPWDPFDPLDPAQLPRLQRYGIDDGAYRAALTAERKAAE